MEFNINSSVRVKLTPIGLKIMEDEYRSLGLDKLRPFTPPAVDADGYSSFQMWDLMQRFGNHIGLSSKLPFETIIHI